MNKPTWFSDLAEKYKDDLDFKKEGLIYDLEERNAQMEAELAELRGQLDLYKRDLSFVEQRERSLRAMIKEWLPAMEGHTEASHLLEGFKRKKNIWDDRLAKIKAACEGK